MGSIRNYPDFSELERMRLELCEYARLKCEQGAGEGASTLVAQLDEAVRQTIQKLKELPDDPALTAREPNSLEAIRALRTSGPRRCWQSLPQEAALLEKLEGALLGRMIGCILGVPVEGASVESMEAWSNYIGKAFPPVDYWEQTQSPEVMNYYRHYRHEYQKHEMHMVPVDDDVIYTELALLILEEYGPDFTTRDVGEAWKKYLPYACTAEEIALNNLHAGMAAEQAAEQNNPYCQWIGAAIRSDGFAFAAPGAPERAAAMAWNDAYLTHRRNGIYGEMFLAAAQAAAFAVDDPLEAVRIGMTEIPAECLLYQDLAWALEHVNEVRDHRDARRLVDDRFPGMHIVHTNNNLCLIVFGLALAQGDIVRGLSQTVAMGLDNDCTAASAGSILGAVLGKSKIPPYLYERFNNTLDTYLKGVPHFHFDDMARRFLTAAHKVYA